MIDFVCIFAIFLEIILTTFIIRIIIQYKKKVECAHKKLIYASNIFFEINKKTSRIIKKINKFVSIVTSKKIIQIKNIIRFSINAIQIILLIRSLNLLKNSAKVDFREIKKLIILEGTKKIIKKLCSE